MSIQFNDTTNYKGLVQFYERELGFNRGDVSGSTDRLKDFAAEANVALDRFFYLAIKSSGTWQIDDSNHTGYNILTTSLVSGQRDYPFTTDSSGNLILDVYRVVCANSSGVFSELSPVDQQSGSDVSAFWDGRNLTGTPFRYDKTANAIFLDYIPSYNYASGLKGFVNREGSYFAYTDITKKPGIPGIFHHYIYLRAAAEHARRKTLTMSDRLAGEVEKIERQIEDYYGLREKDVTKTLNINIENNE